MDKRWLWLLALVPFIFIGGEMVYDRTRGLRNNNPGNIRRSKDQWQGLSPVQTDSAFFQFVSPEYGIRALARVLKNYRDKYGLVSIRDIISRWAPPNENNTETYIKAVSASIGKPADEPLIFDYQLTALVRAIIKHENGIQPYSLETINEGIKMS